MLQDKLLTLKKVNDAQEQKIREQRVEIQQFHEIQNKLNMEFFKSRKIQEQKIDSLKA